MSYADHVEYSDRAYEDLQTALEEYKRDHGYRYNIYVCNDENPTSHVEDNLESENEKLSLNPSLQPIDVREEMTYLVKCVLLRAERQHLPDDVQEWLRYWI